LVIPAGIGAALAWMSKSAIGKRKFIFIFSNF
jgi:hypothetical protein